MDSYTVEFSVVASMLTMLLLYWSNRSRLNTSDGAFIALMMFGGLMFLMTMFSTYVLWSICWAGDDSILKVASSAYSMTAAFLAYRELIYAPGQSNA